MQIIKKSILSVILTLVIFTNICFAIGYDVPTWSSTDNGCNIAVSISEVELVSKAAVLMDSDSGIVLFNKNGNEQLRPASVTKVMTILLIMEALENNKMVLEDVVPCSEKAMNMGGSQIWLEPRDTLTVDEMLKAICVVSANDCCVAMAEYIAGSTEAFVNMMNDKARELGMTNTAFKNCHGLDEDGHLTTAIDIAKMSKELISKYPQITKYTTIWMDSLRDGKSELTNTNKLVKTFSGITGLKTGSTSLALYNISATASRDNLNLIAVIMGGPTSAERFNDASRLLNIGFANYQRKELCQKGVNVGTVKVIKGKLETVEVVYANPVNVMLEKTQKGEIKEEKNILESINAPVANNQKVGEVVYYMNDAEIGRTDVITYYNVERIGFFDCMNKVLQLAFTLNRM